MRSHRDHGAGKVGGGTRVDAALTVPLAPGKRTLVEEAGTSYNGEAATSAVPWPAARQEAQQGGGEDDVGADAQSAEGAGAGDATNAPAATYIIPFGRNPKSAPGEQIIFGAVFTDPRPNDYQLVWTGTGGDFNSAGSGRKSVTVPGLVKNNLYFFIDGKWDKKSAVSVKLELQKKADSSIVQSETWTFGAKTTVPTTVTQKEADTERALPSVYSYKCGPDLSGDGKDDYLSQTILEEFSANRSNLTVADVKPAYAKANGLTTDQQVTIHFFGPDAGKNGTFTVSAGDMFYDQHGGGMPDKATFEAALVRMKEIHVDLPQVYSAEPGKPLGKYTVRRILKTDGTKKLKKWKNA